jgi:hypothetical protein
MKGKGVVQSYMLLDQVPNIKLPKLRPLEINTEVEVGSSFAFSCLFGFWD